MYFNLVPKFKYHYSINDIFHAFLHYKKEEDIGVLKEYFGASNFYFTNYARTSLTLLLNAISNGKKLNVGIQPFTCHTVFESINKAGCECVFLDINNQYTLDINYLKTSIKAIDILIVTHTFGIPANMDEILEIAKDKFIIEDCAHSLFSEYNGSPTGIFGDASIFSFGYGKYPSIGPGGFTIINNENLIPGFERIFNNLPTPSFFIEYKNIFKNFIYGFSFTKKIYGLFTYPIGKKLDKKFDFVGKSTQKKAKAYINNVNVLLKNFHKYKDRNEIQRYNGKYLTEQIKDFIKVIEENGNKFNYYIFPLLLKKRDYIVDILYPIES